MEKVVDYRKMLAYLIFKGVIDDVKCGMIREAMDKNSFYAIAIPENATNRDMVQAVWEDCEFYPEIEGSQSVTFENNDCLECLNADWLKAPYIFEKGDRDEQS